MKNKKLFKAELIVVALLILAIVLPSIIGTTLVEAEQGFIATQDDLNGHKLGLTGGKDAEELAAAMLPDSSAERYASAEEGAEALLSGSIDALLCNTEDSKKVAENEELTIYPMPFSIEKLPELGSDDIFFYVVRKADCNFAYTSKTMDDFIAAETPTVAVQTGSSSNALVLDLNQSSKLDYYSAFADMYNAVSMNKSEYCTSYSDSVVEILSTYSNIAVIAEPYFVEEQCFATSKSPRGAHIREEFDVFLSEILSNGEFYDILEKWEGQEESQKVLENVSYSGEHGVIKIATSGTWVPNTYYKDNKLVGHFIDVCNLFCSRNGYTPEYYVADFPGEIAGLASGEFDLMADICQATEERAEKVNFTQPVLMTYKMIFTQADPVEMKKVAKADTFFENLKNNFRKNFIEENRYKMVFDGLQTTIKIAALATVFGTILGMLICMCRMGSNIYLQAFSVVYVKFIQGTPIVVMLLILYYLVFSKGGVSGFWVSIIGFSLDFSAYVSEILRSGIESIPDGQTMAGRALGFSKTKTFFKIVFPQALINIVPVYSGQLISMVKLTSVVGYIAVQDLTKMSDLIRSVTYEAFFPLISTAIVYFILAFILIELLKILTNKMDPLKRSRYPKGVNIDAL